MYRNIIKGLLFVSPFFLSLNNVSAEQNKANELETETIEVISTTPVPGIGTSVKKVPSNVQAAGASQIEKTNNFSAAEYIEKNLNSVSVGHAQGNIFMPDVSFRGQMASPLLGNPQGLAVFMDGVKVNESFGDVMRWDLVPQNAISMINLIPGTNPVFGLNALGGVLSLTTKSGFQYPGSSVSVSGGSWGRKNIDFEYGTGFESTDLFLAGTYFDETGYRDHSESTVGQFFGKWGWENAETDVDISFSFANTDLHGTQALPVTMLNDIKQAYTWPDTNQNQVSFINAAFKHYLGDTDLLSGNFYIRHSTNQNVNSNINDEFDGGSTGTACDGTSGDEECPGAYEGSNTLTNAAGLSLQVTQFEELYGRENTLTYGVSADVAYNRFVNTEQGAYFSSGTDRTLYRSDDAASVEVAVAADNHYYGFYATNVHELSDTLSLTTSGRYNIARVKISDDYGNRPLVAGKHEFHRFNPGLGLNFNPTPSYTTYISYTEGMRAPTPVELTCADPNAPCKLPNAFLADPPLEKVVAKTLEIGARGSRGDSLNWSAALYNTLLKDDIQFIAATSGSNAGYFDNVGDTVRRGFELGVGWKRGELSLRSDYSYTDAFFDSTFSIDSPNNSSKDGSNDITVRPGNKIPGIPEHSIKLRAQYDWSDKWATALTGNYFSGVYARGDENNQDSNGKIPGYTVVNFDSSYKTSDSLEFYLQVTNLLDEKYETMGILGENYFPSGTYDKTNKRSEQFRGIGLPRAAFVGVEFKF